MAETTYGAEVIARLLVITPRRLQQLTKEGYLPKSERGRYELVPVVQAYIRYLRDRAVKGDLGDDDFGTHKTRLIKAKADIAEIEAAQLRQELLPRGLVIQTWQGIVAAARARLLALPSKAAHQLLGARTLVEAEEVVRGYVYEALTELARDGLPAGAVTVGEAGPEGLGAAAGFDGEPMGGSAPPSIEREQRRARTVADGSGAVPAGDHGRDERSTDRDRGSHVERPGRKDRGRQ